MSSDALHDSLYRRMFDQNARCAAAVSLDGTVLDANQSFVEGCRFTRGELIGKAIWECGWFSRSPSISSAVRAALEGARAATVRFETAYFHGDGQERFIDLVFMALHGDGGAVELLLVTGVDITEQRRAAQQLRLVNELALKAGRMGSWHLNLLTGVMTCTAMCKANYGRGPDDTFTYQELAASVLEEDRVRWRAAVAASQATNSPLDVEYRTCWPDGSVHWIRVRAEHVDDEYGRHLGLSGISIDIDHRKRAEERFRLLVEINEATRHVDDAEGIMQIIARLLGAHMRVSRCAYGGIECDKNRFTVGKDYTAPGVASIAGTHSLDAFGPRAAQELRAGNTLVVHDVEKEMAGSAEAASFAAIGVRALVCCALVKEGRLVAMMAVHESTPRIWRNDEVALVEEVVARSWAHIERITADAALRRADGRKDEFLATLAHELRNPLAPIRAGLQLLRLAPDGADRTRTLQIMDRQLDHMVRIIDDLLDVSRITRDRLELVRSRTSVQLVLRDAIEAASPAINAAGQTLEVRLPDHPLVIDGDVTRLAEVMSNLLDNASKYTPRSGHIVVDVKQDGAQAVVTVSDNGAGIPTHLLSEIFELFVQANRRLDHAQGGLGIGLSLARKLVVLHGGTLEAASPGPGRGSTFTVRLPIVEGKLEAVAHATTIRLTTPVEGKRILVVDDNVDAADLLASLLQLKGHDTRVAQDGEQALSVARAFAPEIVFLDLGMPGMDGFEVARRLQEDLPARSFVLVALTGWGSAEDKQRTRDAGFHFHLTKPVNTAGLKDVLSRAFVG